MNVQMLTVLIPATSQLIFFQPQLTFTYIGRGGFTVEQLTVDIV